MGRKFPRWAASIWRVASARRFLRATAFLLFAALCINGLAKVSKYAVDVPAGDEWEFTNADQLPGGFRVAWLFEQHNEHRIALTKLQTYMLYRWNRWNLVAQQVINYLIYLYFVLFLVYTIRRFVDDMPTWVWLAFAAFLLSARPSENHLWGFQSSFHFAWGFVVTAIFLWFKAGSSLRRSALGAGAACLAVVSFSGGVAAVLGAVSIYAVFECGRIRTDGKSAWRLPAIRMAVAIGPVLLAIGAWLAYFEEPQGHPPLIMPFEAAFWPFFTNLFSSSFGVDHVSWELAWLFFLLVGGLMALLVVQDRGRFSEDRWGILAATCAVIAFLASIALGRAGFDSVGMAKTPRYTEISGLLVPITAAALAVCARQWPRMRRQLIFALWAVCILTFKDDWRFSSTYRSIQAWRLQGLECLEKYYFQGGSSHCPTLYPVDLGTSRLENAKRLRLSFYESLENRHRNLAGPK